MKLSAILAAAAAAVLVNIAPFTMAEPLQSSAQVELAFTRDYTALLERNPQALSQLIKIASARGFSADNAELIAREPLIFTSAMNMLKRVKAGKRQIGEDYLEA